MTQETHYTPIGGPSGSVSQPSSTNFRDEHSALTNSPPGYHSHSSSRHNSRSPSPLRLERPYSPGSPSTAVGEEEKEHEGTLHKSSLDGIDDEDMPSDLRPPFHRPTDGRSHTPLLHTKNGSYDRLAADGETRRRSVLRERDPDVEARNATKKRYTYAAFFLVLSLVSFTVQTETAVYIQHNLKWNKAYAMLYFTHGSWSILWFLQLAILRVQKWNMPWKTFWRRHVQLLHQTALMVEHQDTAAPSRYGGRSPIPYMLKTTAFVTCALTVAGGSWYVAVDLTTASDLTAIYNCSAFFAYAFSVPLLKEKLQWQKVAAVLVAIAGVLVVAYGDSTPAKHGSKSGGGAGGPDSAPDPDEEDAQNRPLGNLVIAIGSVLYGLYEVLYKKAACPPDGTSPGRSMIFANLFGSMIGGFTLLVLWIPLPILHVLNIERFQWPTGETSWMLAISVLGNAIFSGSFLVLISLTSPVLSSVAALLTIFLVALVDQLLPPPLNSPLSGAAVGGGVLIIVAFVVLCYATYREMDEERKKKADVEIEEDDVDD